MSENRGEPVNVALLGYGYAGKTFHAPLISNVAGLTLAKVVSSSSEKVLADFPNTTVTANHDDVFSDDSIDLIVIATPNDTHFDLAKRALNAGKHVVVDKPFTTTVDEAKELIKLSEKKNAVLSVFHNRRWDADFLTIKKLLEANTLGEVMHFESHFDRYRPEVRDRWREQAGAGTGIWFDLGSHLLDQVLQLFGKPDSIFADLEQQRDNASAVDYFHATLHYGKRRVILHGSALVAADNPRFILHGKLGSFVKFGLDTQEDSLKDGEKVNVGNWGLDIRDGSLTTYTGDKPQSTFVSTERGDYVAYYEQVRSAIRQNLPNPVSAQDALAVMELLELGAASSSAGRLMSYSPELAKKNGR